MKRNLMICSGLWLAIFFQDTQGAIKAAPGGSTATVRRTQATEILPGQNGDNPPDAEATSVQSNPPTVPPSPAPSAAPSAAPAPDPTTAPSVSPSFSPSAKPSSVPSAVPSLVESSAEPSLVPSSVPSGPFPSSSPSLVPSSTALGVPSQIPSTSPSGGTLATSSAPSMVPSALSSATTAAKDTSSLPSAIPSFVPSFAPSLEKVTELPLVDLQTNTPLVAPSSPPVSTTPPVPRTPRPTIAYVAPPERSSISLPPVAMTMKDMMDKAWDEIKDPKVNIQNDTANMAVVNIVILLSVFVVAFCTGCMFYCIFRPCDGCWRLCCCCCSGGEDDEDYSRFRRRRRARHRPMRKMRNGHSNGFTLDDHDMDRDMDLV